LSKSGCEGQKALIHSYTSSKDQRKCMTW